MEKSKDEVYGTAINSLDLKSKKKEVLFEKSLDTILSEVKKTNGCADEDPDISTLAVTKDGKSVIYAASGVWQLNLANKKSEQIVKTSQFNAGFSTGGGCINYSGLRVGDEDNAELTVSAYEGTSKGLVDLAKKTFLSKYHTGWYSYIQQLSYPPTETFFVKATLDGYNVEPPKPRSVIGIGTGKNSYTVDTNYYTTKAEIKNAILIGRTVYFIEADNDLPDIAEGKDFNIYLSQLNLDTKQATRLTDLGKKDTSNALPQFPCIKVDGQDVYVGVFESVGMFKIYKVDSATKTKILVETLTFDKNFPPNDGGVVNCFQVTSL